MPVAQLHDRVKMEGVSLSGTADLDTSTGTAPARFRALGSAAMFAPRIAAATNMWYPLLIENESNGEWELGIYKWNGTVFLRSGNDKLILQSSNSGSLVNFTAGNDKTVSLVAPVNVLPTYLSVNDASTFDLAIPTIAALPNDGPPRNFPNIEPFLTQHIAGTAIACERRATSEKITTATDISGATPFEILRVNSASESTVYIEYKVIIREWPGSPPGATKVVRGSFVVAHNGTTNAVVGSPSQTVVAEDSALSTAAVGVSAASASGGASIEVTGVAGMNIVVALEADIMVLYTKYS